MKGNKMKGMKKAVAFFLALSMTASLSLSALATEADTASISDDEVTEEAVTVESDENGQEDETGEDATSTEKIYVNVTSATNATEEAKESVYLSGSSATFDITYSGTTTTYRALVYINEGVVDESGILADLGYTVNSSTLSGATYTLISSDVDAIIVNNSTYTIKDTVIVLDTDADGTDTSDFLGLGSAVAIFGDDSYVTIMDSSISTSGVAKAATWIGAGDLVIYNTSLSVTGGTTYSGYKNTANTTYMVNPPWVLGITGSARTTNVMGTGTTATYVNVDFYAQDWGAVSIDNGSDMLLTVINCNIVTADSGYGAYAIGGTTQEYYYGSYFDVPTYAIIMTGAYVTISSYEVGSDISVVAVDDGDAVTTVSSSDIGTNDGKYGVTGYASSYSYTKNKKTYYATVIESDNFGFMFHANGTKDENYLTINEGTQISTEYAAFLVKKVYNTIDVTGAYISVASGEADGYDPVIVQVMDNDDDGIGAYSDDVFGMPTFYTVYSELSDFSCYWYNEGDYGDYDNTWTTDVTFTDVTGTGSNGELEGDIWNSTGYNESTVEQLTVTLNDTSINGVISSGAYRHVYQYFSYEADSSNADKLGHVLNMAYYNGYNTVDVTLTGDSVWTLTGDSIITSLDIQDEAVVYIPDGVTLTVLEGDYAGTYTGIHLYAPLLTTITAWLGSWTSGEDGVDNYYIPFIFIDGTDSIVNYNGGVGSFSNAAAYTTLGIEYDYDSDDGTSTSTAVEGLYLYDENSGHNGIILYNASNYTIANSTIILDTDADGTDTCDFSGVGAAIAVYGATNATILNCYIETTGVATMPIFVDSGATATIVNTIVVSNGGTLYSTYMNTPDQALMVAPPWILGIAGNSRATNLMGDDSTMNFVESEAYASNWAVLSTDSGSNMILNVYNSSLTLTGSDVQFQEGNKQLGGATNDDNPYTSRTGYGTYAIGDAVETFAGATISVGTYATIFTGGSATYTNIVKGVTYHLYDADGAVSYDYTATESKVTTIESDTFGFMIHQSANYITIENGTIVDSVYATFLVKSGSSNETVDVTVDDATITNGGVLIQVMDNDDATNGGMLSTSDKLNYNGGSMNFVSYHAENDGFNTATAENDGSEQNFTFSNGEYTGNIYNASGSDASVNGALDATTLNVYLTTGATLTGAIASTAAIHVTYEGEQILLANGSDAYDTVKEAAEILEYQNTYFLMENYYDIGHVANLVNYNGGNDINVILDDDAVWYVDGTSQISSLTIGDNAQVIVPADVTLTVGTGSDKVVYSGTVIGGDGIEISYYEGILGSFTSGGEEDYVFIAAVLISGDDEVESYNNLTAYTLIAAAGNKLGGKSYVVTSVSAGTYSVTDSSISNLYLSDIVSGHNGIILVDAGDFTIENCEIYLNTDADGTDTCDFSGKGAAIAVYGDTNATIENVTIETTGVATMPIFVDDGATATIINSTLISNGGTLYDEYMNSPDQALMVAPPWILGIMGSSRTTNLMGNDSTMNFVDSYAQASNWAVLSTDSGSDMYLNIYNSTLVLDSTNAEFQEGDDQLGGAYPSDNPYTDNTGYGTYAIGDAVETFAGATVIVGTYATIFTGGTATYTSIEEGASYALLNSAGETTYTYTATESKVTTIQSDTFGFMIHQSANTITIENGTIVDSVYATFLVKSGSSNETVDVTVDDAEITNGGVLIQVMDNDDATTGGMMSTDDELNTNGGSMNFMAYHSENEGFNTDEASNDGTEQNFTFTNGDYTGNIYNASGSDNSDYGPLNATTLNITLGDGATLTGAIASTAAIHVTYSGEQILLARGGDAYDSVEEAATILTYQNTYYAMTHYYDQGHVANLINYNGGNDINVTLTGDAVWYVDATSYISSLTIEDDAMVVVAKGVTLTVGTETYTGVTLYDSTLDAEDLTVQSIEGVLGSFTAGGDEDYVFTALLVVATNSDEYETLSNEAAYAYLGEEAGYTINYGEYISTADGISGLYLCDTNSGDNGIILIDAGVYTISDTTIILDTDADGTDTCDFSGRGAAIAVYGKTTAYIENVYIETTGVATMPIFVDSGATATIINSTLVSNGGTLYDEYMNSPDQALMVAPPWILGIMGTSRTTNLMGNDSTMNFVDSTAKASNWAVLSTDSGSDMYLNIYNSTLELIGSDAAFQEGDDQLGGSYPSDNPYTDIAGYGTYAIGDAVEVFAGTDVIVGTYATIFTGGTATYTNLEVGETYYLMNSAGECTYTYTSNVNKVTTIQSDTFGFMIHQSANYITIENGTIVDSVYATFLVKSGSSNETVDVTVDDAEISNGGVLIQVMDNDDATTGGMMSADDELNTNGGNMNFMPYHTENEGFNTDDAENDGTEQNFTFTNGDYTGNIYNASGSDNSDYGPLDATTLNVTLGEGATLTGAVASTAAIHVTYDGEQVLLANGSDAYDTLEDAAEILSYQNTYYPMSQYYDQGHVANLINYNGGNDINITLTDDAVWTVDGTSYVTSLTIEDDAQVIIPEGVTLTVAGTEYTDTVLTAGYDVVEEELVNGLANLGDGWALYADSTIVNYTGLVKNDCTYGGQSGWYFVVAGKVNFGYTGLVKYDGAYGGTAGWYYVKNGYVDFSYTGLVYNNGTYGTAGWYFVKNGYVDFSITTVVKYDGSKGGTAGWYYVKNAYVDFSVTGIVYNTGLYGVEGHYYVKNAWVDFSYTGVYTQNGTTYNVKNGYAVVVE